MVKPHSRPTRIAIFASGGGSNAKLLLERFQGHDAAEVVLLVTNNPQSGVWAFGPDFGVPVQGLEGRQYQEGSYLLDLLQTYQIDLIVLAGYLKLVPEAVVKAYPRRILNIHPALLPSYGGKGMYGMNVHRAVIAHQEPQSGITIHYVNEVYDQGEILFQASVAIEADWSPEDLQRAVQQLEHQHFFSIVEKVARDLQPT
ncbi:MAG: phosphoribosylglycinamide formyltransferase [Bacteroidetes bacterium]|nr:MAG: phosphoribosylglycinamide formyltransferase [Bacteroidota bacterium]